MGSRTECVSRAHALNVSVPQARVLNVSVPTGYLRQLVVPFRKVVEGRWSLTGGSKFLRINIEL